MINTYFEELDDIINYSGIILKSDVKRIKLDDFSGVIRGRLSFKSGILDFIEVINLENNPHRIKKKYKYHFMNHKKDLIFRYDNAKHYPELKTFPHHKHIGDRIIETDEPNLALILREIKEYLR